MVDKRQISDTFCIVYFVSLIKQNLADSSVQLGGINEWVVIGESLDMQCLLLSVILKMFL